MWSTDTAIRKTRHVNELNTSPQKNMTKKKKKKKKTDQTDSNSFQLKIQQTVNTLSTYYIHNVFNHSSMVVAKYVNKHKTNV